MIENGNSKLERIFKLLVQFKEEITDQYPNLILFTTFIALFLLLITRYVLCCISKVFEIEALRTGWFVAVMS